MDPIPTIKQRTPSRCREWERQRRLKFNDAISKLGEIVKSINKANSSNAEEADNVQYPKIEIVQKAIICLTNCVQEKTQLKADILALEVKLQTIQAQKNNKKDVSLQVALSINKRSQNGKQVKVTLHQTSNTDDISEKETPETDATKSPVIEATKPKAEKKVKIINRTPTKLPKLLPLTNIKKENTIVMLPAAPYIFPQRPLLFPQPQTIFLVDTNLQPLNKTTTIPIINRNTNDITKTTMVNVLPISAYSHPLSEKSKKITKPRNTAKRKVANKVKSAHQQENAETKQVKNDSQNNSNEKTVKTNNSDKAIETSVENKIDSDMTKDSANNNNTSKDTDTNTSIGDSPTVMENKSKTNEKNMSQIEIDNTKNVELIKCPVSASVKSNNNSKLVTPNLASSVETTASMVSVQQNDPKDNKIPPDKTISSEYKSKDNKLQNILDTTICENVVDAGNARLELAEELLAASPTAAFLMSFPLVSGNRADSPAEEHQNAKESSRRNEIPSQQIPYFEKPNIPEVKNKEVNKTQNPTSENASATKTTEQKYENISKSNNIKPSTSVTAPATNDNPFLNLPLPSLIPSSCTLNDSSFGLDFDCNVSKTVTCQSTSYSSSNNIFYKSDPFNTVKSTIYSTSSISSGHEFNSLGLYPCAMENYSSKNKSEFPNVEENLMKINSSRLTYDIDLGWSHKGFDFVNCTTSANSFHKDNMLTTSATSFSTSYNPFNPDFHVPLVNSTKKNTVSKASAFPEQITSFYSQSANLWSDDVSSIYTNSNVSKNFIPKQQNYFPTEHLHSNTNVKTNIQKQFEPKHVAENPPESIVKTAPVVEQHIVEKYTKKSPHKMHINWMTSEIRPMQNNCNQNQPDLKEPVKVPYPQIDHGTKKVTPNDGNYFPINMHHFPSQPNHEELHTWPTTRTGGTTEISIEPPPINLPTLVGDLALGPHDKKKVDIASRNLPHTDLQSCGNFLSVTQLMNRSTENMHPRPNATIGSLKAVPSKQSTGHIINDHNRKPMGTRIDNNPQICYGFNDSKVPNVYENVNQFSQTKAKSNKTEKNPKTQKNSYSAESLIRGGTTCGQKPQDTNNTKFIQQKYNDFNAAQDSGVAQVSHFPPILDYSDNNYTGQQFSGTTLYNSTTNTISNSFYSNFMPGSSNIMAGNYTGAPFSSDFVDYNQVTECNYTNQKYNEIKMKTNSSTFQQDKEPSSYKSSRRESAAKHKLECSKKESNKKYQSKRPKLGNEVEEWTESQLLWQNKPPTKRHQNLMSEELPFSNYVGNQMPTQYQPDFFNSHLMQSNMQNVGANADRSLSSFPVASRANFNLSALFPEITMKVQ